MKYKASYQGQVKYYNTIEEIVEEHYTLVDYDVYLDINHKDMEFFGTIYMPSQIYALVDPKNYLLNFKKKKEEKIILLEKQIKQSGMGCLTGKAAVIIEEEKE